MERRERDPAIDLLREAQQLVDKAIDLAAHGRRHEASQLAPQIMGTIEGAKLLMESDEVGKQK